MSKINSKWYIVPLLVLFLVLPVYAAQSISNLKSNTPVPLDTPVVISGIYTNTDYNVSFCKGVVLNPDKNYAQIDRFTDQLLFTDGSFYFTKKMTEPTYFRESTYVFRVTCGTTTQDTNFFVSQRLNFFNQFVGEVFFVRDNGAQLIIMLGLGVVLVMAIGIVWAIYKKYLFI